MRDEERDRQNAICGMQRGHPTTGVRECDWREMGEPRCDWRDAVGEMRLARRGWRGDGERHGGAAWAVARARLRPRESCGLHRDVGELRKVSCHAARHWRSPLWRDATGDATGDMTGDGNGTTAARAAGRGAGRHRQRLWRGCVKGCVEGCVKGCAGRAEPRRRAASSLERRGR